MIRCEYQRIQYAELLLIVGLAENVETAHQLR